MTLRSLLRAAYRSFTNTRPLVEIGISRANLLDNLRTYQKTYPELSFAPVLKSNAYGHGLALIARLLDTQNIAFFMVDSYFEARTLRAAGVRSRIAVIGFMRAKDIARNRLKNVDFAVIDIEQLRTLATLVRKPTRIHLKIDSGMHRQGILPADLPEAIELLKSNPALQVVGVCSHFADAESSNTTNTDEQIKRWNAAREHVQAAFPTIEHVHFAATKGIKRARELGITTVRLGIGLYGFDTSLEADMPLKPVLEARSLISTLRTIPSGDFVGYNALYRAEEASVIATVPFGYYEGLDRALSNTGFVQVRGAAVPIAGRISMNMSTLDVTEVPDITREDSVTMISRNPEDPNSIRNMARLAGTTPYVLLVHIPQHLKRVVE